MQSYVIQQY